MKINSFKPGTELSFKSVVSIRAKLYKTLLEDASDTFCIDLSAVTHCDSAGLALLIEAKKLCTQRNKMFKVIGISPQTESLLEFCGVRGILETV